MRTLQTTLISRDFLALHSLRRRSARFSSGCHGCSDAHLEPRTSATWWLQSRSSVPSWTLRFFTRAETAGRAKALVQCKPSLTASTTRCSVKPTPAHISTLVFVICTILRPRRDERTLVVLWKTLVTPSVLCHASIENERHWQVAPYGSRVELRYITSDILSDVESKQMGDHRFLGVHRCLESLISGWEWRTGTS